MADTKTKPQYEVVGYDKDGRKVFHLLVEAVNADVAMLYASAHLDRNPEGAQAARTAVRSEAKIAVGRVREQP